MSHDFKINPTTIGLTWQTVFERVQLGYELQELKEDELTKQQIVKFNDAIITTMEVVVAMADVASNSCCWWWSVLPSGLLRNLVSTN